MKTSMRSPVIAVASLALATALAGCTMNQNLALERARASYDTERRSPDVTNYAKAEIEQAGNTLREAEAAFENDEDAQEVTHLAVLADRQVDIARARAKERATNTQTRTLDQQRDELLAKHAQILAELQARETERGLVITLGDVLFETDRADLRASATGKLLQLVTVLRDNPDRAVLIEGHADARGTSGYNLNLSQRRAQTVERFFVANGIDSNRVVATGYGEDYPVASNATREGQTMNRRVEVVLLNPGATPETSRLMIVR
jgi:outer membrane protein OmpA-like peptidoglycan-associated protein